MKKRYKLISEDLMKNMIEFLDEIQFDAAAEGDAESMHKVNFCTFMINELMESHDAYFKQSSKKKKPPQKKSRDTYVDETFMDWNLPDMTDEEYEKLVDQFDAFLRGWEKDYNKKNEDDTEKESIQERPYKPEIKDVAEYCSLDEIEEMLKDDLELSPEERFELYYEEHRRVKDKKSSKKAKKEMSKILKDLGITPATPSKKK